MFVLSPTSHFPGRPFTWMLTRFRLLSPPYMGQSRGLLLTTGTSRSRCDARCSSLVLERARPLSSTAKPSTAIEAAAASQRLSVGYLFIWLPPFTATCAQSQARHHFLFGVRRT